MIDPIEFGKVLGRLDAVEQNIEELKQGQKEANEKLDKLLQFQSRQAGAASALLLIATTVSAVVGWVVSWLATR